MVESCHPVEFGEFPFMTVFQNTLLFLELFACIKFRMAFYVSISWFSCESLHVNVYTVIWVAGGLLHTNVGIHLPKKVAKSNLFELGVPGNYLSAKIYTSWTNHFWKFSHV
jgi:hypothetical protein